MWGKLLSGQHRPLLAALLAFSALFGMTLWLWASATEEAIHTARARFNFKVNEIEFAVQQRLLAYEQVLRGGVGLFAANDEVKRDEWRTYVGTLAIGHNYPGIRGIGFSRRILPPELATHVQAVRAEGFPHYALRPAGERSEYTSIVYLEPFDWRNQRAFGYDMFSEPVRHEAMVRARDTGQPSISGKVQLVQETKQAVQNGFLMYLPVYRNDTPLGTVEERRAALLGYVYAPFRMNDLMQGILGRNALPDIDLDIHDGRDDSSQSLLFDSSPEHLHERDASVFYATSVIEFAGRHWTLHFGSLPAFESAIDQQKPRLILLGGLLISALFAAFVWSSSLNRQRSREVAHVNRRLQREIAERTQLAQELEQAKETAEAANRAKSAFLASVSHELRTPLTLILAPLDELRSAKTPPDQWHEQLARVQRNALMLLNRVNDLLDFSKAEAGKFDVRWETINPTAVLAPIAEDTAAVAQRKGCTLDWHIDPALDTVCVDQNHFEKIVLNLLANALKFTPAGGWIRLEATARDEQWFQLEVTDSGIGIEEDKLPLLFTRFQQVDSSSTRQYGGTGIGLALVKELAELMGGHVGVESTPGKGSRFYVQLPRTVQPMATVATGDHETTQPADGKARAALRRARFGEGLAETRGTMGAPCPGTSTTAQRPHVLVADDNPDMRDYLARLLGDDYQVLVAENGLEAWHLLQEQAIDVVVSDVMMPAMDGLELVSRIKATPELAHLPVILLTARGGAEACASGLQGGADDYICKPFAPQELLARVQAALRMSRLQQQLRDKTREAGLNMLATGILHNLGNALVGINVASATIEEKLRRSKLAKLQRLAGLLPAPPEEAVTATAPREAMQAYLARLTEHLQAEHEALLSEVETLRTCTEHATAVIASQQSMTGIAQAPRERLAADSLMEMALKLGQNTCDLRRIEIRRDYQSSAAMLVDRHKVLQILLNLLSNACHALHDRHDGSGWIELRTVQTETHVRLEVSDNGMGIEAHHLSTLFDQRFTTKADGHGYGLHSSANWAHELGGDLAAHSDGPGCGARFTLELPLAPHDEAISPLPSCATHGVAQAFE
ncbi:CHASE domain-containing protein [Pseudogulbenkiania sp. MAI-1]|uniref:CHASE domain-containing protein n=1 Tax=Pseudogulbenkiania sp. MAI-1 TaxID=990370 RepID=UPI00045E883C|nr:CHASE domain-containing protein [Pseudogulbenkiania sp. MAI-1]